MPNESAPKPIAPIINLNGSDPDRLSEALEKAYRALHAANEALAECTPHGRDYPRVEDYPLARKQHTARQTAVRGVMEELIAINDEIDRQKSERTRQRG